MPALRWVVPCCFQISNLKELLACSVDNMGSQGLDQTMWDLLLTLCVFLITPSGSSFPTTAKDQVRGLQGAGSHSRTPSAPQSRETRNVQGFFKEYWSPDGENMFPRGILHLNTLKTPSWPWEEVILELIRIVLKLKSWQFHLLLQLSRLLCLNLLPKACRW